MNEQVQQLEEVAARCMDLALRCQNPQARRIMRLLATDLILAADEQRRAAAELDGELAKLVRRSRPATEPE